MAEKDKSVLDKFVDTFQEVLGNVAKGAVTPTEKTDEFSRRRIGQRASVHSRSY